MDHTFIKKPLKVKIFKLEAVDYLEEGNNIQNEIMLIGFFDSAELCKLVETEYKTLPGFSSLSCKFETTEYVFDLSTQVDIGEVYYVQASKTNIQTTEEEVIEIGLFLTFEDAKNAESVFLKKDDSCKLYGKTLQISTYIDTYELNQKHWQEGFSRYYWI